MNLRASYRYQLADHKKSILVFYLVVFCIYLLTAVAVIAISHYGNGDISGSMSGMESAALIFLFVSGMNSFKENFGMLTQNGVSRRSLLVGRIFVMATVCLFMVLVDKVWYFITVGMSGIFKNVIDTSLFMDMFYNRSAVLSPFGLHMESLVFNFASYFMAMCLGYLVTVIFYRMSKLGKLIIGVGVPVLFLIVLPIVDTLLCKGLINYHVSNFIVRMLGLNVGNPMYAVGSFFVVSAITLAASWLVMRRAPLHE